MKNSKTVHSRLAIANDAIFTDLEIINGFYEVGKTNSNYANDAYERLRELNIDPVKTAKLYANATNEVGKLAAYGTEGFQPKKDGKLDTQVLHEYIFKNHAELSMATKMATNLTTNLKTNLKTQLKTTR